MGTVRGAAADDGRWISRSTRAADAACANHKHSTLTKNRNSRRARGPKMDMSGIEPDPSRMLSERDNQLHHMPVLYVRVHADQSLRPSTNLTKSYTMLSVTTNGTVYSITEREALSSHGLIPTVRIFNHTMNMMQVCSIKRQDEAGTNETGKGITYRMS
ncbi:hypothetical protein GY45DRAFT_120828 [Cubamyces sp. BRFM 1775]|nr:hypothetical protein GY45DRAFT_120828 [Cubamyces sp. BRFM 1775]